MKNLQQGENIALSQAGITGTTVFLGISWFVKPDLRADIDVSAFLPDAIDAITERAQSILTLLSSQFDSHESINRMSDETIANVIYSVIDDIDDIKTVIKAHFEAVKSGTQQE